MTIGFKTFSATECNPLSSAWGTSPQLKQNKLGWHCSCMCTEAGLTKQDENLKSYHTTCKCSQLDVPCFHFTYVVIYFIDILESDILYIEVRKYMHVVAFI
jgi:hypothetical protein